MQAVNPPLPLLKTHMLQVVIEPTSFDLIPHLRIFINGNSQEQNGGGLTVIWSETPYFGKTFAQFVAFSPYSDALTTTSVKQMLSRCLAWLSPYANGAVLRISFRVAALRYDGVIQNAAGRTYHGCHCAGNHPPTPVNQNHGPAAEFQRNHEKMVQRGTGVPYDVNKYFQAEGTEDDALPNANVVQDADSIL